MHCSINSPNKVQTIFLCDYLRTPIGARAGVLQSLHAEKLAVHVIEGLMQRNGLDPAAVDGLFLGNAHGASDLAREVARMAGLADTLPAETVREGSRSGLEALSRAVKAIQNGEGQCYLVVGAESSSLVPLSAFRSPGAGEAAEAAAARWKIKRGLQDQFALESHQKVILAREADYFAREIIPIEITPAGAAVRVDCDERPRTGISLEALAALKSLHPGGTVTDGNSSAPADGAAILLICREDFMREHGLKPLAKIAGMAAAAGDTTPQGIGPVPAIEKVLGQTGRSKFEIGLWEIPEDFAAVSLAILAELDPDLDRINPHGGSIAYGHSKAMTGIRMAGSLAATMQQAGVKFGICALNSESGEGQAVLFELAD